MGHRGGTVVDVPGTQTVGIVDCEGVAAVDELGIACVVESFRNRPGDPENVNALRR